MTIENPIAEYILGTIGSVAWSTQMIPQVNFYLLIFTFLNSYLFIYVYSSGYKILQT